MTEDNAEREAFHKSLIDSGLVKQIKPPIQQSDRLPLIKIKGIPLSESIISDRDR